MMKFSTKFAQQCKVERHRVGGFTLIEMMIVAAVVAILAAIALPSYNSYIIKSEIRTAQSDLLALSLNFENRYQRTLSYPIVTQDLTEEFKGWSPSAASNFDYSLTVNTALAYTIKATGKNRQSGCSIIISHENERTLSGCKYADGNWL